MQVLLLILISILPVFLIGLFIYKKDKQKEPKKILIKLFLAGIGSCFLTLAVTLGLGSFIPIFSASTKDLNLAELLIHVFICVALVEEGSKWLMTYLVSYKDSNFDEFYDAILYCAFVALGFACFENIFYVLDGGIGTGILRALFAVPGHVCDAVIMGYFLGLAKISDVNNRKDLKRKNLILSILFPTITHGIYDYCLFAANIVFLIIFFIFIICIYIYVIKKIKKVSSIDKKFKYKDRFCPNCGRVVDANFCPTCGRKND
jgi:RsiW-degrading membrane proteinase PrsW (M82 family)